MKPQPSPDAAALRRAAEARLKKKPAIRPPKGKADQPRLRHELEVHQIELEMQNEELCKAQAEVAADLERYTDLYEFAPVGYFNLSPDGTIRLVNLTGTTLVGAERSRLVGERFGTLVAEADRRKFRDLLVQVFASEVKRSCELALAVEGRPPLLVRVEATVSPDGQECRAVLVDLTERAQADANLAASERRLRAIFDTEPECVKLLAPDGSLLEMNPAGLRMIEADSFQQVEHHCIYPLVVEEHRAAFKALNEQVFAGESGRLEFQITGLKGGRRWLDTHASPLRDAGGKVTALLGITRDITARRQAEQRQAAFAALGRWLNAATDATEAARVIVGISDDLFGWDSCNLELYDAEADRCSSILTVDLLDGHRQEVAFAEMGAPPTPRQRRVLDGEPELILREPPLELTSDRVPFGDVGRPSASLMSVPMREGGQVVGVFSIQSYRLNAYTQDDLTALQDLADHCAGALKRIASEAAQRESEERLRLAVHASNLGLWDWDVRTNEVVFSREWKSQLGYAEHEISNAFAEWESRVHPDDLAEALARVRRALAAAEEVYEVEFRMRHKDGSWRWIYTRAEVFRDPQGQAARVIGCHVDVTGRKQTEQRQAAFATLGRRLNATPDHTAAARVIADTADELFGWDSCKVDFYDAQTDRSRSILTVDVVNGQRQELSPALSDTLPSPRLRKVITTGAQLILRQQPITLSPDSTPFGDKSRPSASIMAVPIREAGKIVGVLAIQSYRLNAYTNEDLAALQDLADHCAGALQRIHGRTELQQERNLLRTVVDHLPDFIYVKDRESRFLLFNAASLRLMKLDREAAVLGRTVFDFFPPEQARAFTEDDQRVLTSGQPVLDREEPITGQDGQIRHLLTTKVPLCDANGQIVGLVGLSHDITGRKQAEEALRLAEEKYRSIFEHAVEGIYQSTPEGRYLTVNPAMAAIYGYASMEAMLNDVTDIGRQLYADPADRQKLLSCLCGLEGAGVFECQMRRRDGTSIWIRQSSRAVRDASGKMICYEGSVEDITTRREAELRFRTLFERAPVGVIVMDPATARVLECNEQAARQLGYTTEEFIGLAIPDFEAAETNTQTREHIAQILREGRDTFETRHRTKTGELRDVLVTTQTIELTGRTVFHCIFLDISESRRAKELLALRARQQAVVADLGLLALAATELSPLLDQAVARVAETFGVEFCKVLELLPDWSAVKLVAGVGWQAGLVGHATLGVDHDSQAGHTLRTMEPVIVEDLRTEARFTGPPLLREHGVVSGLSVIIGHTQQPVGVLGVHSTRRRGFTPDDVSFLQAVANVLAEAIRRHRVEQAMRESEAALVRAQAVAHLGSWRLDVAQNRLTWSAEAHRIFGVPEGTPMDYEFFLARVHPEDRPQVDGAWQAALEGAPYDLEHRILVEDQVKWVREQAALEFDTAGRLLGGLGTVQDITGRKRTEQRLEAFASLGRGLNAAHEVREAARLIVSVADELFGWDACFVELYDPQDQPVPVLTMDTVEGRKLELSVVPRERPTPGPASRLIETGELILRDPAQEAEEARFVPFGDTGRRSASLLFVPLRLHGRSAGLLSIQSYRPLAYNQETLATLQALADYTALSLERLLAQEALRESESRYRTLFAHSPQPMWVFDPVTLGFLEVNEAAVLLYGFTREEFLAMKTTDLRPPEERERHLQSLLLDAPGVRDLGVWRHWKKDQTALWVQVFAHGVEFAGGRAELVLVHDVTAQLAAEAEVVQLSGRLLRAQDEERRRLARELHDSTAQIFAALAMNLAVLGRITPGMDDASRALLAECEIQVRRGTAELRTLAYLLHPPALEALGLTRAIHDYAEGFARRSGVRVELDVAELPVRLPPETELTLFRVLQESLGNVHRHSGSATAAIRLAQDAETVVIEVRDTGCGLGVAELAAATSGSARFGVGIAGMRERLRLLGGRLEVEPALPGLRVRATLPLSATADEKSPPPDRR